MIYALSAFLPMAFVMGKKLLRAFLLQKVQKNDRQVPESVFCIPHTVAAVHLLNKSLCVPVRAKVSTNTSSSIR